MKRLFAVAAFAGLSGCASFAPLDEAERARVRVVLPVAARFLPNVDSKVPLGEGKAERAVAGGTMMAVQAGQVCVFRGVRCSAASTEALFRARDSADVAHT